jgi:uncharacterized membrane protein (GlpM family)
MATPNVFPRLIPLALMSVASAIVAYHLAKDKGRNVVLWTILGIIPFINFLFILYFVGASNLRMEKKIDSLMEALKEISAVAQKSAQRVVPPDR